MSYSEAWNSHSVYFEDPAGNILELIARHTMNNSVDRPFDPKQDILCISEIGVPTRDVPAAVDHLAELGLMTYKTRNDSFNPIGDDNGLLMVVEDGQKMAFHAAKRQRASRSGVKRARGWRAVSKRE